MIRDLGIVKPGTTLYIPFHTFDSNDPSASVTITGLAVGDIDIYKDGSTTERASTAGYTLLDTDGIDFDGATGIHGISIDLSDNTTANFYEAGSQYWVVINAITVDAATVRFILATFTIGYPDAILNTTVATLASQTSFTLEEGPADNDALNGCVCLVHDLASAVQVAIGYVSDYTGATRTVTLAADPGIFTMAAGDNASFFVPANVAAVAGTAQTAGNIIADTEAVLTDSEAVLADTEAAVPVLTDTEAILADTEANVGVLTDTEAILTDSEAILADTNELQTDWTNAGRLDTIVDAILADTETGITERATLLTDTEAILSDTEGLSAGSGLTPLASGTAQGGSANTIQLAVGETFANDELNGNIVKITSGTGAGQSRLITDYVGATDTATVSPNWTTNPDATSVYEVVEGAANIVTVGLTAQTAGDIVADTEAVLTDTEAVLTDSEAILVDTEAAVPVLTDTEAILADSEAVLVDTEAAVPVLTDTEAILADSEAIVADTNELQGDWTNAGRLDLILDAVLADTEAAVPVLTDTEAILSDTEASQTSETSLLADSEAILTDSEAVLLDTEAVLVDTEAAAPVLTDTEAILADTETMSSGILTGTAQTGTLSTTQATTDLSGYTDDQLIGRVLIVTSGNADGEATDITDYANASGLLTFTALTTAMSNGDTFKIV